MRVLPVGSSVCVGRALGAIDVDWGGVAVTDVDVLAPSVESHLEEYEHWFNNVVFARSSSFLRTRCIRSNHAMNAISA